MGQRARALRGGATTLARYGVSHFKRISQLAADARRAKRAQRAALAQYEQEQRILRGEGP